MATIDHSLISHLDAWRSARSSTEKVEEGLRTKLNEQKEIYSEVGYWDAAVNKLPAFFFSVFISNPTRVGQYNEITAEVVNLWDQQKQMQHLEEGALRRVNEFALSKISESNPGIGKQKEMLKLLKDLNENAHEVLSILQKAESSEWWDSTSSNRGLGRVHSDYSFRDNYRATQALKDFNLKIQIYNRELLSANLGRAQFPLREIGRAGDHIMESELAEHTFWTRFTNTEQWQSWGTLNIIRSVIADFRDIMVDIENRKNSISSTLKSEVLCYLEKEAPNFVEESSLRMHTYQI